MIAGLKGDSFGETVLPNDRLLNEKEHFSCDFSSGETVTPVFVDKTTPVFVNTCYTPREDFSEEKVDGILGQKSTIELSFENFCGACFEGVFRGPLVDERKAGA